MTLFDDTRQVTPREIRGVLYQVMERLDSKNAPRNLVELRRMLSGRECRLLDGFVPTIGEMEGEKLLALITGLETEDDKFVREMVMNIPHTPAPHYVHIEAKALRELGLDVNGLSPASYDEIWIRAQRLGITAKTPATVAPSMLRSIVTDRGHFFRRVIEGIENLYFMMEPIHCSDETPRIFRLGYGYVPNKLISHQYFLWTIPVVGVRFTGDDIFAFVKKFGTPEQWAADQAKLNN